jgi:transcriptional regulator with XRE-family HTH domain
MSDVGQEIRRLREAKGWGQPKLAVEAGVAVSGVSQIENGRRNPNSSTLVKLAGALGVGVADLFPKAEAPLWSGESPGWRRDAFAFWEARESLENYCEHWEKLLGEDCLDDRAIEEFFLTGEGWLPVLDVALSAEINASGADNKQIRTEIGKANRRYLELFSKITKVLLNRLEEGSAASNVVRLQEVRDRAAARLPKRAVG